MTRAPNWNDLVRPSPEPAPPAEDDIAEVCKKFFTTRDGKLFLLWMRSISKERVLPPTATSAELHHLEGQRYLCNMVEKMIAQGLARPAGDKT